jgi:hypothetical protein
LFLASLLRVQHEKPFTCKKIIMCRPTHKHSGAAHGDKQAAEVC